VTLYLVRHGETEWNLEQRRQGRADSPLTERGVAQARAAARALHLELGKAPELRIVSSPTGRAFETARIVAAELDLPLESEELLAECDLGDWTGLTTPEVEARDPGALAKRESDKWSFRMPGGESYADVDVRARRWLESLDGRPTLAVSHEMIGRTLCGAAQELSPDTVLRLDLGHGRVQKLERQMREELVDPGEVPASGELPDKHRRALAALESAYLESDDPLLQSGFGGGAERWRAEREPILDGVAEDGELLDVGCANGHLLECLVAWGRERGLHLLPCGVDVGERLVALARRRLPGRADCFWVADVQVWDPPRRFQSVYLLYDCVPRCFLEPLVAKLRERALLPGGRLIVGAYGSESRRIVPFDVARFLEARGFEVVGRTHRGVARFAWIEAA
jgi:probable phosphoglycerate mutase